MGQYIECKNCSKQYTFTKKAESSPRATEIHIEGNLHVVADKAEGKDETIIRCGNCGARETVTTPYNAIEKSEGFVIVDGVLDSVAKRLFKSN